MNTQEKIQAILAAIESKKVSANQIEPSRKGTTVTALKQGKAVRPATVDKLYASLQSILTGSEPASKTSEPISQCHEVTEPAKQAPTQETDSLSARVQKLETENAELKAMITDLIGKVSALQAQNQAQITKDNQICDTGLQDGTTKENQVCDTGSILKDGDVIRAHEIDFVIRLESQAVKIGLVDGTEKKIEYHRYYAKKKIAGKLHRVYLGDMARRNETETKIKAYCQRHGLAK